MAAASSEFLSMFQTHTRETGTFLIVGGVPGSGKSSLSLQFPECVLITSPDEDRLSLLQQSGAVSSPVAKLPPFKTWSELLVLLDDVIQKSVIPEDGDLRPVTVVIDSLTSVERCLRQHILASMFDGDQAKFDSWASGPKSMQACLEDSLFPRLTQLKSQVRRIVLVAHTEVRASKDVRVEADMFTVAGNPKYVVAPVVAAADMALFYGFSPLTARREILMSPSGYCSYAKNPYHISREVVAGDSASDAYSAFCAAVGDAIRSKQKDATPAA